MKKLFRKRQNAFNKLIHEQAALTLAGMEATLRLYLNPPEAREKIPALRLLTAPPMEIRRRAKRLQRRMAQELSAVCAVSLKEESSQVGGGALPLQALPTWVLALRPLQISAAQMDERLRRNDPSIIGRVKEDEVLLDLRTVFPAEEKALLQGVRQALTRKDGDLP